MIPITKQAQQEWNIILNIARNNGFQLQIIHNFTKKLMLKTHTHTHTQRKYTQANTMKEKMYHIYISQFTHTQSYQLIQRH